MTDYFIGYLIKMSQMLRFYSVKCDRKMISKSDNLKAQGYPLLRGNPASA